MPHKRKHAHVCTQQLPMLTLSCSCPERLASIVPLFGAKPSWRARARFKAAASSQLTALFDYRLQVDISTRALAYSYLTGQAGWLACCIREAEYEIKMCRKPACTYLEAATKAQSSCARLQSIFFHVKTNMYMAAEQVAYVTGALFSEGPLIIRYCWLALLCQF